MYSELRNSLSSATRRWTAPVIACALASTLTVSCAQQQSEDAAVKLNQLFDDYWEYQMREYPTWASALGDRRYDSLLTDESQAAHDRRVVQHRNFLNRLNAIDRYQLSETDQVSADIFELQISQFVDGARFNDHYMPINQQGGPHLALPELISALTFTSFTDYENLYKRMSAFPRYVDQHIANMRAGMDAGLVSAKINIEPTLAQMESFIVEDPRASLFFEPLTTNSAGLRDNDLDRLKDLYEEAIEENIVPSYRKLRAFIEEEYLPACRDEFGVWALPDGAERYKYLIQYHTTLPLTPEKIVQTGLDDLARIEAEMDSIIATVGFEGTRQDFFDYLHSDPRFYYTDKDSLLDGYRAILAEVKQHMPALFGILPQADCIVKELEEFRSKDAPTAYYNQAAEDGSRPGFFYANTYNLAARPKYEMEALTYHEAIPGHHLQISIQQERDNLPSFRQNNWFTAFGEGWALYSERLPREIGFYQDPYSDFGRLIYDAWRACRLVVDVGLHYNKWDRQRAIDFMKEHFGGTEQNVISEVDRYIAWPGQALGYKIGQLKILELRARSEAALGDKFRLSEFHDQVLNEGCIPLPALENKINGWIERKKSGTA